MTPADIERAVEALRRAFPAVSDEGVERFRRELAPLPVWRLMPPFVDSWELWRGPAVVATVSSRGDRWRVWCEGGAYRFYDSTRSEAMREAERALGLPECEVVP